MIRGLKSLRRIVNRANQSRFASINSTDTVSDSTNSDSVSFDTVCPQLSDQKCDENESNICKIPLSCEIPDLPRVIYAYKKPNSSTQITTLKNGMRVATEPHFGEYSTIGVIIDAGSRYEVGYPSGISHFLEKLAFNSSANLSSDEIYEIVEKHGALIDCQSTKDTFVYASSCLNSGVNSIIGLIADATLRPAITEKELETARSVVQFDVEDMNQRPNCESLLTDWIHTAAFRGNTLGLPKYCPIENVAKINRQMLLSYIKAHFAPERIVVAVWGLSFFWSDSPIGRFYPGVGVAHDELLASVEEHFDYSSATWAQETDDIQLSNSPPVDLSIAQYTGGEIKVARDLSTMSQGPSPYPHLTHMVLGLQGCGYRDADFVAFCVLNMLMGGGGSFSAGGPGKGMYTRLYTQVLNRYHWMYNATCFNHAYRDSGLFCIQASCEPSKLVEMIKVVLSQFLNLLGKIDKEELSRAKTQLKSQLMLNLETRVVTFEDLGRQILGNGYRKTSDEYVENINQIEEKDLHRVVDRMLSSKTSLVGYGDLDKMPHYDRVDKVIANRDIGYLQKKMVRFFR